MNKLIKVSDVIAQIVSEAGVNQCFMVTGGGAMHLNDAFSRNADIKIMCMHHEQACAMAAEGYARISGTAALVNVTTGPGGINALNGVFGAYTDSIPMLVVSGQVKRETIASNYPLALRQLGDQEADILTMVKPITKFAVSLNAPEDVRWIVEKAIHVMRTGRPGPVWIDVPVDVQGAFVDSSKLRSYSPQHDGFGDGQATTANEVGALRGKALALKAEQVINALKAAKRPIIMPGTGVRAAHAADKFMKLADRLGIAVGTAFNAHDLLPDDHPAYVGKPGTVGDRAGNFAVQNADLVLVLGCRLNIRQISYNFGSFARAATKIMVDIDAAELNKPTLSIDVPVHAELGQFLDEMLDQTQNWKVVENHKEYLDWCKVRTKRYPTVLPRFFEGESPVNPYAFCGLLWELAEDDIVVSANATACIVTFQTSKLKSGQRLFSNSGSASMGYDLPAAIGACLASGYRRVVAMAGDGSIMQNLQELATIVGNKMPIKIMLLSNDGYHSILQTQKSFFSDNIYGCGPSNGVHFPDFEKVIRAFELPYTRCNDIRDARRMIRDTLDAEGPAVCEVLLDKAQPFEPKLSSRRLEDGSFVSSALEDMAPFLPRDEFESNMLIPPA
jgi:acetolactate synthase I/II/III large subunit